MEPWTMGIWLMVSEKACKPWRKKEMNSNYNIKKRQSTNNKSKKIACET